MSYESVAEKTDNAAKRKTTKLYFQCGEKLTRPRKISGLPEPTSYKLLQLMVFVACGFFGSTLTAQTSKSHPAAVPSTSAKKSPAIPATTPSTDAGPQKVGVSPSASTKQTAQEFSTKDADGKMFSLKTALAAGDGVVINFWASWCTACADEIPELEAFQKKYPKYGFFGLNVGEDLSKVQKFVKRNSYPYKVILDPTEAISKKFDVDGLPITIVISKTGQIIYRGSRPPSKL